MAKKRSSGRSKATRAKRSQRSALHRRVNLATGRRVLTFEMLEGRRMLAADFGDAPEPYATLQVDNGPQHEATGLQLGALRSTELDGQPSINADADASDDGVSFGTLRVGQLGTSVTVNIQGGAGKLDAWIDFNGDGSWGGPGEHIFVSQDVITGDNLLTFDIPSEALSGATYARFRLSTAGNLGVGGIAADGEVEDYEVLIKSPYVTGGVFREGGTITTDADGANSIYAADVDGDGDLDILSASSNDDKIAWYENDGSENYTTHIISTTANGATGVFTADLDGDGDLDVLSASNDYDNDKIVWYENNGSQSFTTHIISTPANSAQNVYAADVDGDGDLDILSASYYDNKITWHENDGSQNFTAHIISTTADGARDVIAADVDGDGDLDILSASSFDDKITWYENNGSQNFTTHIISASADYAQSVYTADVDGDGDLDVLSASTLDDKIAWYENDGSQNFTTHIVSATADAAQEVIATDVDGDGDLDILSASYTDDKIAWYENDGSQNFITHVISTTVNSALGVYVGDVDGDGDLDVLSASYSDGKIAWYENTFEVGITSTEASVSESSGETLSYTFQASITPNKPHYISFIVSGSASHGVDYTLSGATTFDGVTGTIAIPAGMSAAELVVTPLEDFLFDLDEEVTVTLSESYYVIVGSGSSTQVITNDTVVEFGDAPSPYPTLFANGGAVHNQNATNTLHLGPTVDYESEGQPSNNADADASDDGVSFGTMRVGQLDATATINVQGGDGKIDAWIDFNGDGSWDGPGEHIFVSQDVITGDNVLTFDIPSWATSKATYARVRLSTAGNLGVGGIAADGEVEDYEVLIKSPHLTDGAFVEGGTITTDADGPESAFAADLDGDGDLDILSASVNDAKIAWYENDGNENYTAHTISTTASGAQSVITADVDGDGDLDVLSASYNDDKIAWYENDGSQNFTAHIISVSANGARDVIAADVDGDGDLDILSASYNDDKIAWYENDGSQNFTAHIISIYANGAISVSASDVDGDGDLDILSASNNDDKIAWYENDGSQNFTTHVISTTADGAQSVRTADIDGDGDLDVLSASYYDDKIVWYENDGTENFAKHTISATADGAGNVHAADLDGDGDIDVLSTSLNDNKTVWYENNGNLNFTAHTITTRDDATSIYVGDVDSDGDLDVLLAFYNDAKIVWYKNTFKVALTSPEAAVSEDSTGTLIYTFQASIVTNEPRYLSFSVSGTATHGVDYTLNGATSFNGVTGTILIPAGMPSAELVITPLDDSLFELDEEVTITLLEGDYVILGSNATTQIIISNEFGADLGDAPSPYPTLLANNGAAHNQGTASTLGLGSTVDYETEGQPSINADAATDDDGVSFGAMRVGQLGTTVTVNVQGGAGKLDAWIDFNSDGSWGGPGEQIFASLPVVAGDNILQFNIPVDAFSGETFARFRLSTTGGLGVSGVAGDGEVEDYQIELLPPSRTAGIFNTESQIDFSTGLYENEEDWVIVDLDGDADNDIVEVNNLHEVIWHENLGGGIYTSHTLSEMEGIKHVAAGDIDQDGDIDLIIAGNSLQWLENDGTQHFTSHLLSIESHSSITIADFNSDSRPDIAALAEGRVVWFANLEVSGFEERTVTSNNGNYNVYADHIDASDIDNDGDIDLLLESNGSWDEIEWISNDGNGNFSDPETLGPYGISNATFVDLHGDGDKDLVGIYGNGYIDWYEKQDGQFVLQGSKIGISGFRSNLKDFVASDLDGDGDIDLAVLYGNSNDSLIWYENTDSQFIRHIIPTTQGDFTEIAVADLNGDGMMSLVVKAENQPGLWYFSQTPLANVTNASEAGTETISFHVGLENALDVPTSIPFSLAGTAVFGVDYTVEGADSFDNAMGIITIPAGQLFVEIVIRPPVGHVADLTKTVSISLNQREPGDSPLVGQRAIGVLQGDPNVGDYGDAPAPYPTAPVPYPTVSEQTGPGHIATGPTLGTTRSTEPFGVNSANADGDSGDDGITFQTVRVGQASSQIIVNVQNASEGAKLDGWIDFNVDGSWGGTREHVFISQPVVNGDNLLTFEVPGDARPGITYARFRLSTAGGLRATGNAVDGEVEDYAILIEPPVKTSLTYSTAKTLPSSASFSISVPVDFDHDGDMDIIAGSFSGQLEWLENDGTGQFTQHVIANEFWRITGLVIDDFDGDGDLDIAVSNSAFSTGDIFLFKNLGGNEFQRHIVADQTVAVSSLFAADIDGDGDIDLLSVHAEYPDSRNNYQSVLQWYENLGEGTFSLHTVTTTLSNLRNAEAVDLDGDGDLDILTNGGTHNSFRWLENDGHQLFTTHEIPSDFQQTQTDYRIGFVRSADLDGDGDLDIIPTAIVNGIAPLVWYENQDANFVQHFVTNADFGATDVRPADLDGDGDLDLLYSSEYIPTYNSSAYENRIVGDFNDDNVVDRQDYDFWRNHYGDSTGLGLRADANGNGQVDAADYTVWRDHFGAPQERAFFPIENLYGPYRTNSPQVADFDGDGDLDLLSGKSWYANVPALRMTHQGEVLSEADGNTIDLTFTLDAPEANDVEFVVNVSGLAFAGIDFSVAGADSITPSTITATLPAGTISLTLTLSVIDDTLFEFEETFTLTLADTHAGLTLDEKSASFSVISDEMGGDFGDAPAPYATLLADDGARHSRLSENDIRLGTSRSTSVEANPSNNADGDTTDDGVTFGEIRVGQNSVTIDVNVQGADGYLDAWIDFNGDGSWGSLGERISISQPVVIGDNTVMFDVPAEAISGTTFARFRVSSQGQLSPTGAAADGEVEDYLVQITPSNAIATDHVSSHLISDSSSSPSGLLAIDLDQDGDLDTVVASLGDDSITWYENDGNENFTRHVIHTFLDYALDVVAGDFDNDGDIDIAAVGALGDKVYWYRNDGHQNFTRKFISSSANGPNDIHAADLDGDGYLDLLTSSGNDDEIAWYQNQQDGSFSRLIITSTANGANGVFAIDVDRDGDIDVLSSSTLDATIAWYENDGDSNFTAHIVDKDVNGATYVYAADMDNDGDIDILSASITDNRVAWYENNGDEEFTTHTLSNESGTPNSVEAVDYDGDGDFDILVASYNDDTISWYENHGEGNFTRRIIATTADGAQSAIAADINGDGILDIISTSSIDNRIVWYERHLPGDFNRDGIINRGDYDFWRDHYGATTRPGLQADGNGDGAVDAADYTVWRDHFEAPIVEITIAPTAPASNPSPTTDQTSYQATAKVTPTLTKTISSAESHSTRLSEAIAWNSTITDASTPVISTKSPKATDNQRVTEEALLLLALDESYQALDKVKITNALLNKVVDEEDDFEHNVSLESVFDKIHNEFD